MDAPTLKFFNVSQSYLLQIFFQKYTEIYHQYFCKICTVCTKATHKMTITIVREWISIFLSLKITWSLDQVHGSIHKLFWKAYKLNKSFRKIKIQYVSNYYLFGSKCIAICWRIWHTWDIIWSLYLLITTARMPVVLGQNLLWRVPFLKQEYS